MVAYIAGLICAFVLAAIVIAWIAYCMFFKERHKSEAYQFDITDIRQKNYELAETLKRDELDSKDKKRDISVGVFVLPSRRKQPDDYDKRPDYPESPVHLQAGPDKLIEMFNNSVDADVHSQIDTCAQYHSDV